jgi:hypothetical protein
LTTEEQDGYIHLTIEALSTDFTIIWNHLHIISILIKQLK